MRNEGTQGSSTRSTDAGKGFFVAAALLAVAAGTGSAWRLAWLCDDAFISLRYALNLSRGLGLVYNAGERVEGFTNPLWTVFLALPYRLGVDPESWAIVAGIAAHAGTLACLAWYGYRTRRAGLPLFLPASALFVAAHPDMAVFATSGLETSLFTFLSTAAFVVLTPAPGKRAAAAAGALLALASLTRPDGLIFLAASVAYSLWRGRPRFQAPAALLASFAVLWAPATALRVSYYGSFLPNTYHAKSAGVAWWSQGLHYAALYFERYPLLAGAIPLAGLALALAFARDARREPHRDLEEVAGGVALATAFALGYGLYVVRVGGDFMFARFLIPVTPFLLLLVEATAILLATRRAVQVAAVVVAAASLALSASPVATDFSRTRGIADERESYVRSLGPSRAAGLTLREFFAGLPIGVLFLGGQARLVYYADPAVAVECETGLTDPVIARQPLAERGRVGHEKRASVEYILDRRRLLLSFHRGAGKILGLDAEIPAVPITFGNVRGRLLRWDPEIVADLVGRGARVGDFPSALDLYISTIRERPDDEVRRDYRLYRRFYFDHVPDAPRLEAFERRLGLRPHLRGPQDRSLAGTPR